MARKIVLTPSNLEELCLWIDKIPLSRPKKKIERDFSDGILAAEIVQHFLPDMVDVHNYVSSSSISQKKINWGILNKKVFDRLGCIVPDTTINDLSIAKVGVVEPVLFNLKSKINEELEQRKKPQYQPKRPSRSPVRQLLLSSDTIDTIDDMNSFLSEKTSRTSQPIINIQSKSFTRLDYEELKQQCLIQQEEIQVLQVKMRRLEHIAQLKDIRIDELTATMKECPHIKPITTVLNKPKKK
ncbi:hypothetical protein I4U23_006131 [Adineta vaga]|nr:hypothetical protein I4U23_006131 [Adineta vaga]